MHGFYYSIPHFTTDVWGTRIAVTLPTYVKQGITHDWYAIYLLSMNFDNRL